MNYIETKTALSDKKKIKSMTKSTQNKLLELVIDIKDNPRNLESIGEPEKLKYTEIEMYSRSLNKKDRIVYGIEPGYNHNMSDDSEIIVFYQYLGHYTDK
ncbi:MAG: type II toxin-antitoxin system YoeB family toxin [Paludibacter sp.]